MVSGNTKMKAADEQCAALARWDQDGGAPPSDSGLTAEVERHDNLVRSAARAAFDDAYESSARGEHRYPDSQQSDLERNARDERDALKRKLAGAG